MINKYSISICRVNKGCRLLIFILFICTKIYAQTCAEIIGYYPNWQWYDRAQLVNPSTIAYSKYSIINYAFFKPEISGNISSTDAWADQNLLLGQINWSTNPVSYYPNTSIVSKAHNANVKVLPSIGGWTLSDNFPGIAASATKRIAFAHDCCELIRTYNFDGIDIDWEYPGYTPNSGTTADKQNFTILLQQIKDSLVALGAQNNKTYLLTACVAASKQRMMDVEWNNVQNILDIINLMSYDFFGSWDAVANHNSPLHKTAQGDPTFNIDSAVQYLLNHYQVLPSKLAAGVAFYGRSAKTTSTPTLYAPINGVDNITFSEDLGTPLYYNIVKKQNLFTRYWDSLAKVPYQLGNGSLLTFLSYDDEESIGLKANYIKSNNLRGAIIWEITGDYLETSPGSGIIAGTPLIDTLRAVLCNGLGGGSNCSTPSIAASNITQVSCSINWNNTSASSYQIQYKRSIDSVWNSLNTTSTTMVLSNLICNTNYQVKIKSYCSTDSSAFSLNSTFTTLACSTASCLTPTSLIASTTQNSINLNWGNTSASSFEIQYKPVSSAIWNSINTSTNNYLLSALLCNTTYEIKVKSICGSLQSAFSNSSTFTTAACNVNANCNNTWNAATVYLLNDTVIYNNQMYRAKWWTQNNIPSSNYGDCCVWDYVMPCGGFTAATCYKPLYDSLIAYTTNQEVFYNGIIYKAKWWTLNQHPMSNSGPADVWLQVSNAQCFTSFNIKAFLQGYYIGSGNMRPVLYNTGIEFNSNSLASDSMTIELHEQDNNNTLSIVATYKEILQRNGRISCTIPNNLVGKNCYVVLKHRSGIETWSANPVIIGAGIANDIHYDFSTAANKAYESNQVEVESGVWALYSGDVQKDLSQSIDLLDIGMYESDNNNFLFGYIATDINGDGNVDLLDATPIEQNVMQFVFSAHP